MAAPSKCELLNWAENYVSTWNAGDKDAWVANWRKVLKGEIRVLRRRHAYKQYQPEYEQGL